MQRTNSTSPRRVVQQERIVDTQSSPPSLDTPATRVECGWTFVHHASSCLTTNEAIAEIRRVDTLTAQ